MKTITYLYISLFAFILFFFITIFIVNGNPIFFDEPIRNLVSSWHADDFFKGITHFGNVYYILILILIGFLIFHKKSNFKFLMSMMLINTAANVLLKLFFARPRKLSSANRRIRLFFSKWPRDGKLNVLWTIDLFSMAIEVF